MFISETSRAPTGHSMDVFPMPTSSKYLLCLVYRHKTNFYLHMLRQLNKCKYKSESTQLFLTKAVFLSSGLGDRLPECFRCLTN